MTAEQILREHPRAKYYGRIPSSIGETDLSPDELGMKRLSKTCAMIAAHFHTKLIDFVWKSTCYASDNYYVIQTTDGTRFIVE